MPRLTRRRLLFAALIVGFVVIPLLTVAALAGVLSWRGAVTLGGLGMIIGLLGINTLGLRRVDSRLRAGLQASQCAVDQSLQEIAAVRRTVDKVADSVADIRGVLGEDRLEIQRCIAQTTEHLGKVDADLVRIEKALERVQSRVVKPVTEAFKVAHQKQVRLHNRLYAKVEAQADLHRLIQPRAPMPLLGGWALDADIMHLIVADLWARRPELIVECGSGSSSLWLGYMSEQLGSGRLVALEHDERYAQSTTDLIRAHNLQDVVDVRYAPLRAVAFGSDGREQVWYEPDAWSDLTDIGLMFVDGPPAAVGPESRYPAGPLLIPRCAGDALILLDDTERRDEKAISDAWLAEFPYLSRTLYAHGSAHAFRRQVKPIDGRADE
jgi:Methyltransferase domain